MSRDSTKLIPDRECADCGGTVYALSRFTFAGAVRVLSAEVCECDHWQALGPANDDPPEVVVEYMAAELAVSASATTMQGFGWTACDRDTDPQYFCGTTNDWESGWLGRAIHDHDEEQSS